MRNDIHRLRCDMDGMAQQVVGILREYQVAHQKTVCSSEVQTETSAGLSSTNSVASSSILTNSGVHSSTSSNHNSEAEYKLRESAYKKDIFELKVKLKEMEAKVVHLRKQFKAKEVEPRSEYIIDGPNKEEKVSIKHLYKGSRRNIWQLQLDRAHIYN